ncbi:MAG: helix-turn-helix domain-containing protein, partial [Acidobacteria bacterium]|nr:helix-turn-helix domain-containing protein [Acidobacteriota bacterium]
PAGTTAPATDLLAPADVAKVLGVSEDDVMAIIGTGELKAKKIGSSHRVTRAALDTYLKQ